MCNSASSGQVLSPQQTSRPLLSICILTYNRSALLANCIESLAQAARGYWDKIEVIVSDNASTDGTQQTMAELSRKYPIRYFRNATNIGADRNVFAGAARASADYVWVFSDDDEFCANAILEILPYIERGFDLVIANFSIWSRDMKTLTNPGYLSYVSQLEFKDPNLVLCTFGTHLAFISGMVMRKSLLFSAPEPLYTPFVRYGLPHAYSICYGLLNRCWVAYLPTPILKNRADNSDAFLGADRAKRLIEVFVEGAALVYEQLERDGYDRKYVIRAKELLLRKYLRVGAIVPHIYELDRASIVRIMYSHYRCTRQFWLEWLPVLVAPRFAVVNAHRSLRCLRKGH